MVLPCGTAGGHPTEHNGGTQLGNEDSGELENLERKTLVADLQRVHTSASQVSTYSTLSAHYANIQSVRKNLRTLRGKHWLLTYSEYTQVQAR